MAQSNQLEQTLKEIFADKAPPLPESGKKLLVQYAPWLALIGGILSAWAAWNMWHWAHIANTYVNYANQINQAFGNSTLSASRLNFGVWLGILVLAIQAVLLLLAFPGLRDRKKTGWNLVYYSVLVSIAYGVVVMFTSYGGFGSLLWTLIGAAIGFYFLFQVRSRYVRQVTADSTRPSAPPA
jgi:uncharacterized membrane protein